MNSSQLIASVKINGSVPESDQFNDANVLLLADEVLSESLLARIVQCKEEYFVFRQTIPLIQDKYKYRIPSRAIGGILRDVQKLTGTSISSLPYIAPEEIQSTNSGNPSAFYIESNSLCVYPAPASANDSLILKYFIKPGRLILPSDAGQILAIDSLNNTVTLASVPTSFVASAVLDAIKGTAEYEVLSLGHKITNVAASVITLDSLPADLEVGDWMSPTGTSPFPNIPENFHAMLSLFTAAKCLQSLGQVDQESAMLQRAEIALASMLSVVSPRVQGEPQKVTTVLF